MERNEPGISTETALHVHHIVRHAGNVQGSDVENLHGSDESLVECAPENPVRIEFLFELDQVH